MELEVRLFAGLRDAAGADCVTVDLADGSDVAGLLAALRAAGDPLGELLSSLPVRVAVNRSYSAEDEPIREGDEVALVPPISGGAPVFVAITGEPLDATSVIEQAAHPAAGATVLFQGMTRDVPALEYEAYSEMAEQRIASILEECVDRHGLSAAAASHRTGTVPLGEPSVLVAASAPHRPEAFAGAREAIDRIKAEAPIWKVEHPEEGDPRRVEGTLPPVDGAPR
jgi:molybdopterin synthase catalytic subunit